MLAGGPHLRNSFRVVTAPPVLSLQYGEGETLAFLRQVCEFADGKHPEFRGIIDLKQTRNVELGAALFLAAELDRWQRRQGILLHPEFVGDWDPRVRLELQRMGFFKILKTELPAELRNGAGRSWIQFVSGSKTIGRAALLLRRRMERELGTLSKYHAEIYVVLFEAMKNALEHAYPDDLYGWSDDPYVGKRWWMAASVDHDLERIEVAFLDLGITIPRSLPHSWMWSKLSHAERSGTGSASLVAAMQYGHSRLGTAHRGKGFRDINAPALLHPENYVSVLSGQGMCFTAGRSVIAATPEQSLAGTLIKWYFKFDR